MYKSFGKGERNRKYQRSFKRNSKRKIIGVDGFGGIGKTALVQEIIKSHSDVGFDKVIWQTASTRDDSEKMTFATVLDAIATQLNRLDLFKLKREEIEIKIRELLQEQPVLIVLDNMETSDEPQNEIIQNSYLFLVLAKLS
ncbi:MAG: hypothetical protein HC764_21620 [Pleurocapsa sp. CRU_1_2]|nr:hypothetical protein [Pleurocapsa sp. CRU_1_2]